MVGSILCCIDIELSIGSILDLDLTVSKVSVTIRTSESMAETRSQALLKNTVARDNDGAVLSRFEALEKAIEMQNERHARMDESVREMIETFKLMTNNNPMNQTNPSTSDNQPMDYFRRYRQGT